MSVDLENDRLLTLKQASRLLPGRPHQSSLLRWGKVGVGGVRLALIKVGGRWHVEVSELERFVAEVTKAAVGIQNTGDTAVTSASQAPAAEEAGRKLDAVAFGGRWKSKTK